MRAFRLRLCLGLGALAIFAGCQAVQDNGRYAVTAMKAPFYKYGPAQAFGADFALVRGQRVTMIERGFGFSRVLTEDGVSGFLSTDDIAPSPDPIPKPQPQPRVVSRRGGTKSSGSSSRRKPVTTYETDAGLFNVNDIPLPSEPELPKKEEVQPPKPDAKPAASSEPKLDAAAAPAPAATPAPKASPKKKRRS